MKHGDTDGAALLAPLIHLNGSSAVNLLVGYGDASAALRKALDTLYACAPNARDYYPQGDTAYRQAAAEHEKRIRAVDSVLGEIEMIVENINEQVEARLKP